MDNCPVCGRQVDSFFDHIAIDCDVMSDEEVEAAMVEAIEPCVGCGDPDCDFDCDGDYDAAPAI